MSQTPPELAPYVLTFCRQVCAQSRPVYLSVAPLPGAKQADCFPLVEKIIGERGGQSCFGWRIWEWPKVMIEAEFHAVWQDGDGSLHDFSPTPTGNNRILFLPDPTRRYEGRQVNNIRHALRQTDRVRQFIQAHDAVFEFMNRGDRADLHELNLSGAELQEAASLKRRAAEAQLDVLKELPPPGRNDPCPCESGKKFKRCHGS